MEQYLGKLVYRDGINHFGQELLPLVSTLYEGDLFSFDLDEDGVMVLHDNTQIGWLDEEIARPVRVLIQKGYQATGSALHIYENGDDFPEIEISLFLKEPERPDETAGTLDSIVHSGDYRPPMTAREKKLRWFCRVYTIIALVCLMFGVLFVQGSSFLVRILGIALLVLAVVSFVLAFRIRPQKGKASKF